MTLCQIISGTGNGNCARLRKLPSRCAKSIAGMYYWILDLIEGIYIFEPLTLVVSSESLYS